MGVNYRKSITRETAFPAALQDTIAGYAYLTRKGYKRIAIGGDSAGAGLALALMQYLAKMSEKDDRPAKIILPAAALFYSPWADLTVSHDYEDGVYFDISALNFVLLFLSGNLASHANLYLQFIRRC